MDQVELFKHLSINALFWTGALSIVLSVLAGSAYFLLFFIGLVVLNYILGMIVGGQRAGATNRPAMSQQVSLNENTPAGAGSLGFVIKPITYPKVLDEETRDYVPEFMNFNIQQGDSTVFNGNLARETMKKLRDSLDAALKAKVNVTSRTATPAVQTQAQVKPASKKGKKKK